MSIPEAKEITIPLSAGQFREKVKDIEHYNEKIPKLEDDLGSLESITRTGLVSGKPIVINAAMIDRLYAAARKELTSLTSDYKTGRKHGRTGVIKNYLNKVDEILGATSDDAERERRIGELRSRLIAAIEAKRLAKPKPTGSITTAKFIDGAAYPDIVNFIDHIYRSVYEYATGQPITKEIEEAEFPTWFVDRYIANSTLQELLRVYLQYNNKAVVEGDITDISQLDLNYNDRSPQTLPLPQEDIDEFGAGLSAIKTKNGSVLNLRNINPTTAGSIITSSAGVKVGKDATAEEKADTLAATESSAAELAKLKRQFTSNPNNTVMRNLATANEIRAKLQKAQDTAVLNHIKELLNKNTAITGGKVSSKVPTNWVKYSKALLTGKPPNDVKEIKGENINVLMDRVRARLAAMKRDYPFLPNSYADALRASLTAARRRTIEKNLAKALLTINREIDNLGDQPLSALRKTKKQRASDAAKAVSGATARRQ